MKELSQNEIACVSGAGLLANIGASIGNIIDSATSLSGKKTDYIVGFTKLFQGIEAILRLDFSAAVMGISDGVTSIVETAKNSKAQ